MADESSDWVPDTGSSAAVADQHDWVPDVSPVKPPAEETTIRAATTGEDLIAGVSKFFSDKGPVKGPAPHVEGVKTEWSDIPQQVGEWVAEQAVDPVNLLLPGVARAAGAGSLIMRGASALFGARAAAGVISDAKPLVKSLESEDSNAPDIALAAGRELANVAMVGLGAHGAMSIAPKVAAEDFANPELKSIGRDEPHPTAETADWVPDTKEAPKPVEPVAARPEPAPAAPPVDEWEPDTTPKTAAVTDFSAEPDHPLKGNEYFRGTSPAVEEAKSGDKFYSSDRETAEEYAANGALQGIEGTVEKVPGESLPRNLFSAYDKPELAGKLGINPDEAFNPDFDGKVKEILQKKGYEGVRYDSGTDLSAEGGGNEEIHVFGKSETPASVETPEPSSTDEETHGIAQRVSDVRAEGGNIEPVEPGEGISAEASVEHGRDLLKAGQDPKQAIDDFTRTGAVSPDGIALARAEGERRAKAASAAYDQFGEKSPEYQVAAQADSEWTQAIKPMQTAWHKIGQAQQGETEIDTGNFHGLRRAYQDATGRDFTPEQARQAKEVAGNVKAATDAAEEATQNVLKEVAKEVSASKPSASLAKFLSEQADAARERIRQRVTGERTSATLGADVLADYAIIGADYLAKGVTATVDWGKRMVDEFGEEIRPHLDSILEAAKQKLAEGEAQASKPEVGSVADVWARAKKYIDAGESNFDDLRHKIAVDTGLSAEEVTRKLAGPKSTARMTDEMYAKLAARRTQIANAKGWLKNQATPGWLRFARAVPQAFFDAFTAGHGTVGMVTHAGINAFDPKPAAQAAYWDNFLKQFKLLGWHDGGAYHERMMQDLVRDPNYIAARRAGLANDPLIAVDDYQRNWLGTWLGKLGLTGNRGFDALKLFRQAKFNQIWDGLPESLKTPDSAKLVADEVNHATGVVKMRFREWSNWAFFAPKLEGSRWAWMIGDPAKAATIFSNWEKSSPAEQAFAMREVKQKAALAGTYISLLAINQGLLKASGSAQSVNFTDPNKSDFLAFKAGGYKFGIISPMLGTVRLLANLIHASVGQREGFEKRESRSEEMIGEAGNYARGKLSPFAGVATDVATQSDFQKRPMPFSSDKVPASLRRQGIGKYTVPEYALEHFTPIPASEAIREVWRKQGMDETTINHWLSALGTAVVGGTTGARLTKDTTVKK